MAHTRDTLMLGGAWWVGGGRMGTNATEYFETSTYSSTRASLRALDMGLVRSFLDKRRFERENQRDCKS